MAIEKSFQLYINNDNVKQYFTTSGGALNGAAIGGKYITMRTSSTTAKFTMNDAGRDVLFPSSAAKAHKIDVWAQSISTLNSSKNTINIAIAGRNAITTERIRTSLTEHTGSVSGTFTKSNTSAVYVLKIVNGFHAAGVRDTSITAYFTQYSCAANKVGNGVKSVSVSNAEPYEGETVTFSAELYNGANFDGWYSDEACTQLVSSNLTHSTTAAADLTLYAKATIDADIYNCSAVAGENIASATVSDDSVASGDSVTFTAQLNEGCLFDGWYSDSSYSTLVSTSNPYTTTITSDTTLYAKGTRILYSVNVGTAEHGTATVSANTAYYGDSVTFTFTPENENWELYGWYSDEAHTQLVSEANPYTFVATENVTLYPVTGKKRYTITLESNADFINNGATKLSIMAVDPILATEEDCRNLRAGNFGDIADEKVIDYDTKEEMYTTSYSVSIRAYKGAIFALFAEAKPKTTIYTDTKTTYFLENEYRITNGPYFFTTVSGDAVYEVFTSNSLPVRAECYTVSLDGVEYSEVYPKKLQQGTSTTFTASLLDGYKFDGWYSDAACNTLVSVENPAYIVAPSYTGDTEEITTLTLYAKATKSAAGTGLYIKRNGSYVEALAVYKKIDGVWQQQDDPKSLFLELSSSEYNYVYSEN